MTSKQAEQKLHHDKHVNSRSLLPGALVMIRLLSGSGKWIPGIIIKKLGPVTYHVEVAHGQIWKQHIVQLKLCEDSPQVTGSPNVAQAEAPVLDNFQYSPVDGLPAPQDSSESSQTPAQHHPEPTPQNSSESSQTQSRRYPQRQRRPPDRFMVVSEH